MTMLANKTCCVIGTLLRPALKILETVQHSGIDMTKEDDGAIDSIREITENAEKL